VAVVSRLTWRDAAATVLVVVLVALYLFYTFGESFTFLTDAGDVAAVGLILGFAACVFGGWSPRSTPGWPVWAAMSTLAILLAIVVMATEKDWWLAVFMIWLIALWAGTTLWHAGLLFRSAQFPARPGTSREG
jgi:hypothetical protein